ncbi:hypothetical protein MesoLjLa_67460 (plasmid) [Mesorhizobium sp. L-2-11]|nr:hypothetical protein MesoLjLa_67460 [Mesorhizobium sp. L-2-11]
MGRAACRGRLTLRAKGLGQGLGRRQRQGEEATCFIRDIAELGQAAAFSDDIEQIAEFGGGGIGPMSGRTGTGFRPAEPDEH